ncbi:conserved hypothetical protein [Ricinus communis]|uniref:Uncharacterized protein n=1 Tax=Ricinus communis TaxID=3988 RepID=B9SHD8_RICCO|nr:conserved hypothetical protein [Ricinus communis]
MPVVEVESADVNNDKPQSFGNGNWESSANVPANFFQLSALFKGVMDVVDPSSLHAQLQSWTKQPQKGK